MQFIIERLKKFFRRSLLNHGEANEEGFVLVVTLVVLLLLIVLGISTTTNTDIELKIAGNEKADKINFYVAEGSVYAGAQQVEDGTALTDGSVNTIAGGTGGQYSAVDNGIAAGSSLSVSGSQVHVYTVTGLASNNNSSDSISIGYKKRF